MYSNQSTLAPLKEEIEATVQSSDGAAGMDFEIL